MSPVLEPHAMNLPAHFPHFRRIAGSAWIFLSFAFPNFAVAAPDRAAAQLPIVLSAAQAELARSMDQLKQQEVPPYYLSYEIVESHSGDGRRLHSVP